MHSETNGQSASVDSSPLGRYSCVLNVCCQPGAMAVETHAWSTGERELEVGAAALRKGVHVECVSVVCSPVCSGDHLNAMAVPETVVNVTW